MTIVDKYRIVGADEFDPESWISDSPIAKALIGKAIDDTVEVQTPPVGSDGR